MRDREERGGKGQETEGAWARSRGPYPLILHPLSTHQGQGEGSGPQAGQTWRQDGPGSPGLVSGGCPGLVPSVCPPHPCLASTSLISVAPRAFVLCPLPSALKGVAAQSPGTTRGAAEGGSGAARRKWDLLSQARWPSFQAFTQVTCSPIARSLARSLGAAAKSSRNEPRARDSAGWKCQPTEGVLSKSVSGHGGEKDFLRGCLGPDPRGPLVRVGRWLVKTQIPELRARSTH